MWDWGLPLTGWKILVLRLRSGFPLQRKFDLNLRFASILGIVWGMRESEKRKAKNAKP